MAFLRLLVRIMLDPSEITLDRIIQEEADILVQRPLIGLDGQHILPRLDPRSSGEISLWQPIASIVTVAFR